MKPLMHYSVDAEHANVKHKVRMNNFSKFVTRLGKGERSLQRVFQPVFQRKEKSDLNIN